MATDELELVIGALEAMLGRRVEPFDAKAFVEMFGEQVLETLKGVRDEKKNSGCGDGVVGD